ncbi:type IV pilus modification protein PilV [Halomonas heilongjiangensis]|uniref:Type IV pilus modification protein PilV n=2 Tax=Halomonas heilongjiangensis TaxID=1387883 RepID=A0A2N7TS13_9GAMM|nr:type IV pilus modification protein PilV [Halomonas heilongjiangensis]PMR70975.1 type IV pilus modification protein PilV [Halomonas heilongjiangensis]PXX88308.1 type IV pilus modification protein PilV [Halomonas heilongjiangensis]
MSRLSSQGFTLLEALIAVLVLSLGLLGVAAMQLKAMQSAHVAYQRSVATLAAQDAVERLWVALGKSGGECPSADDIDDINDWGTVWGVYLGGLGVDSPVMATGCEYTVTVAWDDARFDGEDVSSLVYVVRLPGAAP